MKNAETSVGTDTITFVDFLPFHRWMRSCCCYSPQVKYKEPILSGIKAHYVKWADQDSSVLCLLVPLEKE